LKKKGGKRIESRAFVKSFPARCEINPPKREAVSQGEKTTNNEGVKGERNENPSPF